MFGKKIRILNRNHHHLHAILFMSDQKNSSYQRSKLVIMCHGFKGDKSEKNRFNQTAQELNNMGLDALSFDFSGSGENKREPILLSRQVTDLEDVGEWATQNGYDSIGTIGLSFGGITSLMAKLPDRKAAVFWAPAMYPKKSAFVHEYLLSKLMGIFPFVAIKRNSSGDYPPILINSAFTKEVYKLTTDSYLKHFLTPSLILQGKKDTVVKPQFTEQAYAKMPQDEDHQYVIIKGAAHDFNGYHLLPFINHTVRWFLAYL